MIDVYPIYQIVENESRAAGIGLETVRTLAYAGADVFYTCRNLETGRKVAETEFKDTRLTVGLTIITIECCSNHGMLVQSLKRQPAASCNTTARI